MNDRGQLDKIYFANLTWADYFDDLSPEEVVAFYEAKAMFAEYFHAEDFIIRHLLRPGEIVFFDNNRVLHGRDAFTEKEGGGRVLEGMYFDWDPFVSKIKVLNRKLGYPFPFKYHTPPHFS